jgi:hypothetical protein
MSLLLCLVLAPERRRVIGIDLPRYSIHSLHDRLSGATNVLQVGLLQAGPHLIRGVLNHELPTDMARVAGCVTPRTLAVRASVKVTPMRSRLIRFALSVIGNHGCRQH